VANTTSGDGNAYGTNQNRRPRYRQDHLHSMDLPIRGTDAMFYGSGYALPTFAEQFTPTPRREFPIACRTWIQPLNLYLLGQDDMLLGGGLAVSTFMACQLPPRGRVFPIRARVWLDPHSGVTSPEGAIDTFNPTGNEWSFAVTEGRWSMEVRG
jgi:hypothetical protein